MSQKSNAIQCPHCGKAIDVNEALSQQLTDSLQREYEDRLANAIKQDRAEREQRLREKIEGEQAERIKEMEQDLTRQEQQIQELNRAQSKIARLEREKKTLSSEIELRVRRELGEQLDADVAEHRRRTEGEFQLKLNQKDQTIARLRKDLQEASTHAEPPAPELKGDALVQLVADYLTEQFPPDDVQRIGPGKKGADVLQTVNTQTRQNCGAIYYECKNTKRFQNSWIEKLRQDMLAKSARTGVLVSHARPAGADGLLHQDGVWICSPEEFKGLCLVLRDSLIQYSELDVSRENRDDKAAMLYEFFASAEFQSQAKSVVRSFNTMRADLDKEKTVMEGLWRKRERQIDNVLTSASRVYHSIKDIAGSSVQTVPLLELTDK